MVIRLNNGAGCVVFLSVLFGPGFVAAYVLHAPVWALIGPVAEAALMLGIAALPSKRKVTPQEFADELERHLAGTDSDDDWDCTSSVRIFDPMLEDVRRSLTDRFNSLSNPEDREELRHIIEALRRGEFPGATARKESKQNPLGTRSGL